MVQCIAEVMDWKFDTAVLISPTKFLENLTSKKHIYLKWLYTILK